jgi:pimeloyl-ACP methyl ester carboxylesterase
MPAQHVNGIEMVYETVGQGEPLLLLHGLGSRSEDWQLQLPAFAARYSVVVADMRGHGRTAKPPGPYSVPLMAADVLGLLDALGIDAAHVVGLSMGGMIAFQMAVDRPERVRSLVIVNSGPALVAHTLSERLRVWQRLALARLSKPARTAQFLGPRLFPKPEQAELRRTFIAQWAQNDPRAYRAAMRALIGWSVLDRISAIHCPTLVISGDRDYTPPAAKEGYTALIPGARLVVVQDSGHATPIDQAEAFNACVLEFLEEVGRLAKSPHKSQ